MAPTLIDSRYSKDLSTPPRVSGWVVSAKESRFIMPLNDNRILRLVEDRYHGADFGYITKLTLCGYSNEHYIFRQIGQMREAGLSDTEILDMIANLQMDTPFTDKVIARFSYDDFTFLDDTGARVQGVQIRGAFVDEEYSGVGLAGAFYRQLVKRYRNVAGDHIQTELGAALWGGTICRQVGVVRIYDCQANCFIDTLGEGYRGRTGYIPWDLSPRAKVGNLRRFKTYPFSQGCRHHIVFILSL